MFGILFALRRLQIRDRLTAVAVATVAVGAFVFGWRWPRK